MIRLSHMCDKCFRLLGDSEKMFAFKIYDDENEERMFKGHEHCVQEMIEIIQQLYNVSEENGNE